MYRRPIPDSDSTGECDQPPPLTVPELPPPEPLPFEPLPLEPLLDPEPPPPVPLPLDPLPEPELYDPVEGGGLGLLGAGAGAEAAGAWLPWLTVTASVVPAAVVCVELAAGWLGSLEAVAFVRTRGVVDLGFGVLGRIRL
jgi:hypothetical protein